MTVVRVDDDFARFGAKSYAINKINSVEVRERQPHGKAGALLCGILGMLLLLGAAGELSDGKDATSTIVLGLALCGIAYWQWQRTKIREYRLFLMTSSSETQAFVTRDEVEVASLRTQIEAAMTRHSQGGIRN